MEPFVIKIVDGKIEQERQINKNLVKVCPAFEQNGYQQ
jgi:hypothetical protein